MKAPVHIVWFKRDLRTLDHAALHQASRHGPVLPLYAIEEEVVRAPDFQNVTGPLFETA